MIRLWLAQIRAVMRLEMKKTFFARRGLWVYLVAFAPAVLFMVRSLDVARDRERLQQLAAAHPISQEALRSVRPGLSRGQVVEKLGEPYATRRRRLFEIYFYTDGESDITLRFRRGELVDITQSDRGSLQQESLVFATVFQFYCLRLAIFFGCVGIFVNLFRGEMLDKSLHFYLLAPIRREVLLAGKYLSGLIATVVIFTSSTALQLLALSWHLDRGAVAEYLRGPGWEHVGAYLGVTALACIGYGSVFLAAGLLFRNPVIPAAGVLLWESANVFLPTALKKISVIFYLQSLCPVVAPPDRDMPSVLALLVSAAEPASVAGTVTGLVAFTLVVLVIAARQARRIEINYSAD